MMAEALGKVRGGGVGALEERNARRSEPSLMHSLALTLIFRELAGAAAGIKGRGRMLCQANVLLLHL